MSFHDTNLGRTCFVVRSLFSCSNMSSLKNVYFEYFHAAMEYGITFWGNSIYSKKVFLQLKRMIRFMTGSSSALEHHVNLCFRDQN